MQPYASLCFTIIATLSLISLVAGALKTSKPCPLETNPTRPYQVTGPISACRIPYCHLETTTYVVAKPTTTYTTTETMQIVNAGNCAVM